MHNPNFDDRGIGRKVQNEAYTGLERAAHLGILFASGENWRDNRRFALR